MNVHQPLAISLQFSPSHSAKWKLGAYSYFSPVVIEAQLPSYLNAIDHVPSSSSAPYDTVNYLTSPNNITPWCKWQRYYPSEVFNQNILVWFLTKRPISISHAVISPSFPSRHCSSLLCRPYPQKVSILQTYILTTHPHRDCQPIWSSILSPVFDIACKSNNPSSKRSTRSANSEKPTSSTRRNKWMSRLFQSAYLHSDLTSPNNGKNCHFRSFNRVESLREVKWWDESDEKLPPDLTYNTLCKICHPQYEWVCRIKSDGSEVRMIL